MDIVPKIGEIRAGTWLGLGYSKPMVWLQCPECLKCRWVQVWTTRGANFTGLCDKCYRRSRLGSRQIGLRKNGCRGGRWKNKAGYVYIRVYPDDFFYPMVAKNGYVAEHRLVVAKALGRNLHRWELVHHKDSCPKDDNRYPETLQLVTDDRHRQITILEQRIRYLEKLLIEAGITYNCVK